MEMARAAALRGARGGADIAVVARRRELFEHAPAEFVQRDEVGKLAVGAFGSLFPDRTVGLERLVLRSPAPVTGNTDSMNAAARKLGVEG
jgi:hypothetical protein